jgi:hypothetical protein
VPLTAKIDGKKGIGVVMWCKKWFFLPKKFAIQKKGITFAST